LSDPLFEGDDPPRGPFPADKPNAGDAADHPVTGANTARASSSNIARPITSAATREIARHHVRD